MTLSALDQNLRICDAVQASIEAASREEAIHAVRADLEVLDRDDLLAVATGLAVMPCRDLLPPSAIGTLHQRIQQRRLRLMWAGSDGERA